MFLYASNDIFSNHNGSQGYSNLHILFQLMLTKPSTDNTANCENTPGFISQKPFFLLFSHKIIDYSNMFEPVLKIQSYFGNEEISLQNSVYKSVVQTYMLRVLMDSTVVQQQQQVGLLRRKARIPIPGQSSERNMKKNISSAISSKQIRDKNSKKIQSFGVDVKLQVPANQV